jgi:uncharacterized protein with beta-barrel porin domain
VPALLLPLSAANAFLSPSAGCVPFPYTTGDLTCTNTGTITTSGVDGIDAPATNGNATTTNSGTINAGGGVAGILTTTDFGNATTTNTGAVNVGGNFAAGIVTQVFDFGNATTTNQGSVINTGGGFGILTSAGIGNATTNNSGTVSVSGAGLFFASGSNPAIIKSGIVGSGSDAGLVTSTFAGNATTNNHGTVDVSGPGGGVGIVTTSFGNVTQFATSNTIAINSTTATTNNFGSVNVSGNFSTGILTATGFGILPATAPDSASVVTGGATTATTNNFGNVSVSGLGSAGIVTMRGGGVGTPPATVSSIAFIGADATTTNSGNVSVDGTVGIGLINTSLSEGGATFGSGISAIGILTEATFGNATTINSGNVNVTGFNNIGILTATFTGTATTVNSGTVSVVGTGNNGLSGVSSGGFGGTNIGIETTVINGNATVINSGTVSVTGPNNIGILISSSGASLLVNSGTISAPGGIAIQFANPLDPATLTLQQGSFIVGAINLIGPGDTVNVNAGNLNLTFNNLAGVNVTGTAPFVVSGNRIVSVDPTGFAVTDRALMDFTRAISATLGGRASDAAASGVAGPGGALGFAAYDDSVSRFDDAFAQAMGYAKAADNAMLFKNPTMTAPDGTTVWAKGFYGQRTQQADGPMLRNVTNFYGGAIGIDKLARPDLRLGGLLGGGAINTSIDFNSGGAASDIVFAGVYGRKDFGPAFVDFALLGGHTGNRTTRNINNNLVANGLEIATASFGGWFFSPEVAAGYRYDFMPGWTVTPAARLRYLAASYDGFTETGSSANLTAGGRTLQNTEERADLTLTRTMLSDAGRFQVGVTAGVLGQQRTGSGTVNAILLGQALAFATPGKSSIGGGYAGASLDWRMRSGLSLFAAAEYTATSDSSNTVTGKAGLRYGF